MTTPRGPLLGVALLAALMARQSVAAGAQNPARPPSVEARLTALEHRAEIESLLLDSGRHLDARDFGAYAALFTKAGVWIGGGATVAGPANIKARMERTMTGESRMKAYHMLSNFVIAVNGETATAQSRWALIVPGAQGAAISQAGRYDDTLVREDGRWRFLRRTTYTDTPEPTAPAIRRR